MTSDSAPVAPTTSSLPLEVMASDLTSHAKLGGTAPDFLAVSSCSFALLATDFAAAASDRTRCALTATVPLLTAAQPYARVILACTASRSDALSNATHSAASVLTRATAGSLATPPAVIFVRNSL